MGVYNFLFGPSTPPANAPNKSASKPDAPAKSKAKKDDFDSMESTPSVRYVRQRVMLALPRQGDEAPPRAHLGVAGGKPVTRAAVEESVARESRRFKDVCASLQEHGTLDERGVWKKAGAMNLEGYGDVGDYPSDSEYDDSGYDFWGSDD